MKKYPGKAVLKITLAEPKTSSKLGMYSIDRGFEMNDEMAAFLQDCPEFDVQVVTY